jgi:lipopolysaccharide export system permease protein
LLLNLPAPQDSRPAPPDTVEHGYCGWVESLERAVLPKTAKAQTPAQLPAPKPQAPVRLPPARPQPAPQLSTPKFPVPSPGRIRLSSWSEVTSAADRVREADQRADRYAVEVHKKWAISMACVSFVIIGIVMALRFPRAGIGLVIGGGLAVFSIHYVGLTAGESLADRGLISPWLAMWLPNIVLTIIGVFGLLRVSRESGSTRGGDFQEILDGLLHLLGRARRRIFR